MSRNSRISYFTTCLCETFQRWHGNDATDTLQVDNIDFIFCSGKLQCREVVDTKAPYVALTASHYMSIVGIWKKSEYFTTDPHSI